MKAKPTNINLKINHRFMIYLSLRSGYHSYMATRELTITLPIYNESRRGIPWISRELK